MRFMGLLDAHLGDPSYPHYDIRDRSSEYQANQRRKMVERYNARLHFEQYDVGRVVGVYVSSAKRSTFKLKFSLLPAIIAKVIRPLKLADTAAYRYAVR